MPYGKNTPEYRTVKESFPQISAALAMKGGIDSVCDSLLGVGLINNDQKAEANNNLIGAKKRASDLASLLLNKVEQDTKNFYKLIGVLQQERDIFGSVLEHMQVSDDGPSGAAATRSSNPDTETVHKKQPASTSPKAFSDDLTPTDLVAWLSQQFQAKGLTLDPTLGQKLIADDINGEAFMDLKEKDLSDMGFTKGQRMKILKIIDSVKGGNEEIVSASLSQQGMPDQEEEKAVDSSDKPALSIATLTSLTGKGKEVEIIKAVVPNWKGFGLYLDFDNVGTYLDTIDKRNTDPADCCQDMFKHWLNGNGIKASWSNVIKILKAIGLKVLAQEVEQIVQ